MDSGTPTAWSAGHTIIYLAGEDSRVDRANIALLQRVVRKSTTPVSAEIWYHRPLRLSNWAEAHENVRYRKLRSPGDFVLAERLIATTTDMVIYFSHSVLLHSADIWQLLGLAAQHLYTVMQPQQVTRPITESRWSFALRSPRLDLALSLHTPALPGSGVIAINKRLMAAATRREKGFLAQKQYADLLRARSTIVPFLLTGRSRQVAAERQPWLQSLAATLAAFASWRTERRFPAWFTARLPLFHVAQLAMYLAALTAWVSPAGAVTLVAFAVVITPWFSLRGVPSVLPRLFSRPSGIVPAARLFACRLLLLLLG